MATLRRVNPEDIPQVRPNLAVDDDTMVKAGKIINDVQNGGEKALLEYAVKFGDMKKTTDPYLLSPADLKEAYDGVPEWQQQLLQRVVARVRKFADAQRQSVNELTVNVEGGQAGHTVAPVDVAGCYAPGGRFPLPSSVIMTAVTAFAAGVKTVIVASPRPAEITKAAAYASGAHGLITIGGCQGIAAMAFGTGSIPACDVIVGPGNRWVTAAKKIVNGRVAIDMLAGPSELEVLADHTADPATVASDLLGQAEHDTDAIPFLVTTDPSLPAKVEVELTKQLAVLPTKATAGEALKNGYAVVCKSMAEAIKITNRLAPEHLELLVDDFKTVAEEVNHYGGLFVGSKTAEVLGDYGAGPNHTLPTGGTARYTGGLSVFNFLRIRTWLRIDDLPAAQQQINDSVELAKLEGLIAHARSAARRKLPSKL